VRYYFHYRNGQEHLDPYGIDLETIADAKNEALRLSSELLTEYAMTSAWTGKRMWIWVTDQPKGHGRTLFSLALTATEYA
jgi:hypothetical protein